MSNLIVEEFKPTMVDIFSLQKCIEQQPGALTAKDLEDNLQHTFAPGMYGRTLFMPKGMLVVGKVHRQAHLTIVSKGKCIVYTTEGKKLVDATTKPVIFCSESGVKRVGYMLEDTYWTTIHLTNETDVEKIEEEITINESEFQDIIDNIGDTNMKLVEQDMKDNKAVEIAKNNSTVVLS